MSAKPLTIEAYSLLQMPTTIQVSEKLKRRLLQHKQHPRETYEDIIARAVNGLDEDEGLTVSRETEATLAKSRKEIRADRGKTLAQYRAERGL